MVRSVDPETHKRYLDYRDRHAYFGATTPILTREQFLAADAEQRELEAKGDSRDDEEEARWDELSKLLFRD
jgi:beta-xylosidase